MGKRTAERRLARENGAVNLWRDAMREFGFDQRTPIGIVSDKLRDIDRHADAAELEWYRSVLDTQDSPSRWVYNGDVNLEHGGVFMDLSTWEWGYVDAIRVEDLGSACGFTGACLIERCVIHRLDDARDMRKALGSCGWFPRTCRRHPGQTPEQVKATARRVIAEAMLQYGFADCETIEVVQLESDGLMGYDGWAADKRLHNCDLMGYVKAVHLKD
jgi:hypothetical protein